MSLTTEVIDCSNKLKHLKDEWNQLLWDSDCCVFFLTWEWIEAWWNIYGGSNKLFLILIRNKKNKLIGIAPFYIKFSKVFKLFNYSEIKFIGIGGDVSPNYLNIITEKGKETDVVKAIIEKMKELKKEWDFFNLEDILETSFTLTCIEREFKERGWFYNKSAYSVCPYILLPESWDTYLKEKSKNFRKKLKEHVNRLNRDNFIALHRIVDKNNLCEKMELLKYMHDDNWSGKSHSFCSDTYLLFHKTIAARSLDNGWLRLYFLVADGKEIGALYCFGFNGVLSYYQSGRLKNWSKKNIGTVIIAQVIQESIKDGMNEFDFLRGEEPYKFRWANRTNNNIMLFGSSKSLKGLFCITIIRIISAVKKKYFKT